jgi:hypothetical protein
MKSKMTLKDPVMRGSLPALRRAARAARALAIRTGTPLYVWQDGRVVNLNPKGRLKKPATPRLTSG